MGKCFKINKQEEQVYYARKYVLNSGGHRGARELHVIGMAELLDHSVLVKTVVVTSSTVQW